MSWLWDFFVLIASHVMLLSLRVNYNDSHCSKADGSNIVTPCAYMLFYKKRFGTTRFDIVMRMLKNNICYVGLGVLV